MVQKKDIGKLIREFLEYLELERGHSQLTIRNYDAYLKNFAGFMEEYYKSDKKNAEQKAAPTPEGVGVPTESVGNINLDLVKAWRLALHRRKLSNKTVNYYIIALRSFLKYLSKMDVYSLSAEKIELADTPERIINFLEPEELQRLLGAYGEGDVAEIRNRAILETLFSTGLRVSELVALDRDKINLERGEFSVMGKGGKTRVVFLSNSAIGWLKKYIDLRKDEERAVFTKSQISPARNAPARNASRIDAGGSQSDAGGNLKSQKQDLKPQDQSEGEQKKFKDLGGRLTPRQIERIVQDAATQAGIVKQVTPHVLRHSFATDILRAGADIRSVQSLLGHSSVTTTQVYTHITDKHLRDIHQKFHNVKKNDSSSSS